jgi:ribA/ribD-fused uncharacterized protein
MSNKLHRFIEDLPHNDTAVFFYGSLFSQWAHSPFKIDGVEYSCAEQYMMAMKAKHFGDKESLSKIMAAENPAVQKAIGRQVKNFNAKEWSRVARSYVLRGTKAKFDAHPVMKEALLSTGERMIVEASPTDCIWGIGLPLQSRDIFDLNKWRGSNWLGLCIMEVRKMYQENDTL